MKLLENKLYLEDIKRLAQADIDWKQLDGKTLLISGATGMIGSCFIDVLMWKSAHSDFDCVVYAMVRNEDRFINRFSAWNNDNLIFIKHDVNEPFDFEIGNVDYVIHLASNTHPIQYSTDPIGTISANIIGTYNVLNFAASHNVKRVAFSSSNEIYGENRGDKEFFDEQYCGYINCNTLRAGYPESKRCGEALCQAYIKQKGINVVIPRFTRSYGPTMLMSDSKAISQFIKNALNKENIVLKSAGTQYYSYTYVCDAVSGLLYVLLYGECGNAYNISDVNSDIMLKDLAAIISEFSAKEVVFELPDNVESAGYSTATKARIDSSKLQSIGWKAQYGIKDGIERTLSILSDVL